MKCAQIGEDVRREHRDPADQSEGSSESRLFAPNWVTPLQLAAASHHLSKSSV